MLLPRIYRITAERDLELLQNDLLNVSGKCPAEKTAIRLLSL